jgi:hypothetical protein
MTHSEELKTMKRYLQNVRRDVKEEEAEENEAPI